MRYGIKKCFDIAALIGCLLFTGLSAFGCDRKPSPDDTVVSGTKGETEAEVKMGELTVKGKKVAFAGDGFTVGSKTAGEGKDYVDVLAERTGLVPCRLGTEAETAADLNKYKKNKHFDETTTLSYLVNQNTEVLSDCSVLVIWVGTYDYYFSSSIGETDDTDTSTFCGGLNYAISSYRKINPQGQVVLVTPLYRTSYSGRNAAMNHDRKFLLDYREAVISVSAAQRTYLTDIYYLYDAYSLGSVSQDGLYVNETGHKTIAERFLSQTISMADCKTMTDAYSKLIDGNCLLNPKNIGDALCVFYGDSVSARAGFSDSDLDYKDQMQKKLGFTFKSYAVGGTTYAPYNDFASNLLPSLVASHSVANILKNRLTNGKAQVAFLFYGTNDYHFAIEVGKPGTDDTDTVCGAMQLAIDTLRKQNPDIEIVVITPIARTIGAENPGAGLENALGYVIEDYVKAITEVAVSNDVWLCRLDRLFTPELYTFDVKLDDVHANPNGHKLMADYIIFNTVRTGNGRNS